MLKSTFLLTLTLALPLWGSSWGLPSKAIISQMAVVCYSGGKVIFQDESISDFIKPSYEKDNWTFIVKSKKIKIHVTGNCLVYEADKNSTYPMPVSDDEVKLGIKDKAPEKNNSSPDIVVPSSGDIMVETDSSKDEPIRKVKHGEAIITPDDPSPTATNKKDQTDK